MLEFFKDWHQDLKKKAEMPHLWMCIGWAWIAWLAAHLGIINLCAYLGISDIGDHSRGGGEMGDSFISALLVFQAIYAQSMTFYSWPTKYYTYPKDEEGNAILSTNLKIIRAVVMTAWFIFSVYIAVLLDGVLGIFPSKVT